MSADKLKQYIALFGGWLSAVYLFLGTLNVRFEWFHVDSINAFQVVLGASVPFILAAYGVWKNSYIVTSKARKAEKVLQQRGLK